MHARQRLRFLCVNAFDFSRCDRASEQLAPQHSGQSNIACIARLAADLELALHPRCWIAHNLFRGCHRETSLRKSTFLSFMVRCSAAPDAPQPNLSSLRDVLSRNSPSDQDFHPTTLSK